MRIHTKHLTADDLERLKPEGTYIEITEHGSRKRARAFEVKLYGEPGKDAHGITRKHPTGGAYGTTDGLYRALTWVEWGDWMVELFKIDPGAIIGSYVGQSGFLPDTWHASVSRPERENAPTHQYRWERELYAAADRDREVIRDPNAPQVERHAAFCRHNLRSNPEGSRR
jgi:hypothetical protein